MKRVVIDIESNGLLDQMLDYSDFPYKLNSEACLWCVVLTDIDTKEVLTFSNEQVTKNNLQTALKNCEMLIAHNGVKFDLPVLKLFGVLDYDMGSFTNESTLFNKTCKIIDTLIISRLLHSDRYGGHSLHAWGERLHHPKTDFRQVCIDKGYISPAAPKGAEFLQFCPEMVEYCIVDTQVTADVYTALLKEQGDYKFWNQAIRQEHLLADVAVGRENFGFYFDKEKALECLRDLAEKMETITSKINPLLPKRSMNKGELKLVTPPAKQLTIKGEPTATLINFCKRHEAELTQEDGEYIVSYKDRRYAVPLTEPLETMLDTTIDHLDHVKMHLIQLGWHPIEWRERDLTKDAKKQNLPLEKRQEALKRWYEETIAGKYTQQRLEYLDLPEDEVYEILSEKIKDDKPVRVPTSPSVRVGVEKHLCPNLTALGEKVAFAEDFSLYLTYKHRKSSIAGGDIEDMDFDKESPNTGFLKNFREVDERVPTPAIEVGANTSRYRHISVANIPRISSVYGPEMRSLFGCGEGFVQFGFDYASLENRIQGHYVHKYKHGPELAEMLIAEKPNDLHSVNAQKLGISRTDCKSVNYAALYGAQAPKLKRMLNCDLSKAKQIFEDFWESVPALKTLKENLEQFWISTGKKFIRSIDGRKIFTRSKHSLLNALFQSAGVIFTKYVFLTLMFKLKERGLIISPFEGRPDVCSMIEYHDEAQLAVNPKLIKYKVFKTEEEALEFVHGWEGQQLSDITKGTQGFYVALPNMVSEALEEAMKEMETLLEINVMMGMEYKVNRNWAECH